jgi:hypothetical protein
MTNTDQKNSERAEPQDGPAKDQGDALLDHSDREPEDGRKTADTNR